MAFRACTVSFVERGQRQTVKVDAETAYEAAALALKAFAQVRHIHGPRREAVLTIEVTAPRIVKLKVEDVLDWLYVKPARSPEQKDRKQRLKALLADDRH